MSGGSYDYLYSKIENLAEEIECDLKENFMRDDEEWDTGRPIVVDRMGDLDEDDRKEAIKEVKRLVDDLHSVAKRAKALEWWMSYDTNGKDFLEDCRG